MKISHPSRILLTGGCLLLCVAFFFFNCNAPVNPQAERAPSNNNQHAASSLEVPAPAVEGFQRNEIAKVSRTLQLKWNKASGNESPEGLLVVGWDSSGTAFSLRSDEDGRVTLPKSADKHLLFLGTEGKAVGSIIRVIFRDNDFEETVTLLKPGHLQVQLLGDDGQAIPNMDVRVSFPIEQSGTLSVPIDPFYKSAQGLKLAHFFALFTNFGAELNPNVDVVEIVRAMRELPQEYKGEFVRQIVEASPNSAWIGFPYLEPIWQRSDENGFVSWNNLPANMELRYSVGSEGLFIPQPQPIDDYAVLETINSTERLQPFSGVFKVSHKETSYFVCRVITDTSVTGQLPRGAALAKELNLDLWLVSKASMGLEEGTSSVTLEWHLELDKNSKFYKAPVSPGFKRIAATWYSSPHQAYFAYKNFYHSPGDHIDLGRIQVLDSPDTVFEIVAQTPAGLAVSKMSPELTQAMSSMVFEGHLGEIGNLSDRDGSPTPFIKIPFDKGMRLSGLPQNEWAFFPGQRSGEFSFEDGSRWSWFLPERIRFSNTSESLAKIPLVLQPTLKWTKIIASPAPGSALPDRGYVLGIFDSNGKVVVSKSKAAFVDDKGRLVVDCQLPPGLFSFAVFPKQSNTPHDDLTVPVAGGIVEGVLISKDIDSVSFEIPMGVNIEGTITGVTGEAIKRGELVSLTLNPSGNFGSTAAYIGNPSIVIPILDDRGHFRIFGLPASSAFMGGGFGRHFILHSENQNSKGLQIQVLKQ